MFGEGSPTDPQEAAAKRKQLVFELNRNGQYLHLKEQLKAGVLRIVKEQYHKSGGMGREEMQASCSDSDCMASHHWSANNLATDSQGQQSMLAKSTSWVRRVRIHAHICHHW